MPPNIRYVNLPGSCTALLGSSTISVKCNIWVTLHSQRWDERTCILVPLSPCTVSLVAGCLSRYWNVLGCQVKNKLLNTVIFSSIYFSSVSLLSRFLLLTVAPYPLPQHTQLCVVKARFGGKLRFIDRRWIRGISDLLVIRLQKKKKKE